MDCAAVLPAATRFEQPDGQHYAVGHASAEGDEDVVGWVALSTEVVDIPAYSGKPLATLIGLTTDGVIAGAKVIHHSEPILLVGIPESRLFRFVSQYAGMRADAHVQVGRAQDEGAVSVDVISGATVTSLAQNRTILTTARTLGAATGVIDMARAVPGHFVEEAQPWSWQRMIDEGVFGRLTVTQSDMEMRGGDAAFVDIWFTIADAPQVGRALLGDANYEYQMSLREAGQHLFVVFGNGSSTFKGSAFVRGGIFDRIRIEQGLTQLVFRDTDYTSAGRVRADGAPHFKEGAAFITRGAALDPGAAFTFVFLGSRYNGRGGFTRDFTQFEAELRLPESIYVTEGDDAPIWVQAWRSRVSSVIALGIFLAFVLAVFAARRFTTADSKRLRRLHVGTMVVSFVMAGLYMGAQPSVTQILTLVDSIVFQWRLDLFLSEPTIFLMWVFIFIVSLIWGRGVFCGWVCPYGAMTELVFELGKKLGVRGFELPDRWHRPLRWARYVLLAALVPLYLYDTILAEKMAEIEPFKSTFLVPIWTRHWALVAWWLVLLLASLVWWRPFCRYLCPLGAGLAIFNSFRFSGPRRRQFCSQCSICTRTCEPRAIRDNGTIDPRECLNCMQCEANYRDDHVCPPLIGIARLTRKGDLDAQDEQKLAELHAQGRDV